MTKTKTEKLKFIAKGLLMAIGIVVILNTTISLSIAGYKTAKDYLFGFPEFHYIDMTRAEKPEQPKEYAYNEQVPEDVILAEMRSLAQEFEINADNWEAVLRNEATCVREGCEKGKLDNLAKNPSSTALGLCQYLIRTWEETESFKQYRRARTDYKACLWEMALDIQGGQSNKWQESLDALGLKSI